MLLLAGDIGGTKTILRLVDTQLQTVKEKKYSSSDYSGLESIVNDFLETIDSRPVKACFAIAGAVLQGRGKITNLEWSELDEVKLQETLNIKRVCLINDFIAIAYNIILDENKDIYTLQKGEFNSLSPIAIIGAGTGLGKAFAIPIGKTYKAFPSEGGHSNYASRNELEDQLLVALRPKYKLETCQEGILSVDEEGILSGPGIADILKFLAPQYPECSVEEILNQSDSSKAIAEAATSKTNPLCEKTMDIFIEAYGAIAGDFALNLLPFGGLYLAGGIAAKNVDLIETRKELFLTAFNNKVRVNEKLLKRIPIHIVLNQLEGLMGAVRYVAQID
ncbi:MAG: glucokinase [Crocosphaera sp.]